MTTTSDLVEYAPSAPLRGPARTDGRPADRRTRTRLGPLIGLAGLPVFLVGGLLALALVAGSVSGQGSATGQAGIDTCAVTGAVATATPSSGTAVGGVTPAPNAAPQGLDGEQLRNAGTIVAVGRDLAVPVKGLLIALATALQESTLRNLTYGDRDSLGLFQQRAGWGSASERTDPATATRFFFQGGRGGQPGLLDIAGWQSMSLTQAAQAVQRSAFPDAYAHWESTAQTLLGVAGVAAATCTAANPSAAGLAAVTAASRWLGTPYSWGGGDLTGPTQGFGAGAGVVGFDCSSLARYAWYVATAGRVVLPRVTSDQAAVLTMMPTTAALAPGDLLFFHDPTDPALIYHHVGIYAGNGAMIHAPHTGAFIEVVQNVFANAYYRTQFAGAVRPVDARDAPTRTIDGG